MVSKINPSLVPETSIADPARRDFLEAAAALTAGATLGSTGRAWAAAEDNSHQLHQSGDRPVRAISFGEFSPRLVRLAEARTGGWHCNARRTLS